MGAETVGAERAGRRRRQVGERSERAHPETAKHVDQLWRSRTSTFIGARNPATSPLGTIRWDCCAGSEFGGEGAVGHTDPNVGAFGDDLGESFVDEVGDGGVAAEIAMAPASRAHTCRAR